MAWAYGMTSHRDKHLFAAITRAALPHIRTMGSQEISQLFWSMATLNFASESLCSAASQLVPELLATQGMWQGGDDGGAGVGGGRGKEGSASAAAPAATAAGPGQQQQRGQRQRAQQRSRLESGNGPPGCSGSGDAIASANAVTAGGWSMQSVTNVAWAWSIMRPGDTRMFRVLFAQADALLHDVAASARLPQHRQDSARSSAARDTRHASPTLDRGAAQSVDPSHDSGAEEVLARAVVTAGHGGSEEQEFKLEEDLRHVRQVSARSVGGMACSCAVDSW